MIGKSKARAFQYKISHNIYYNNEKLYRIGKVDSPMCSFCHTDRETLKHLFTACYYVNMFWRQFINTFGEDLNVELLQPKDILLGIVGLEPIKMLLNHLLILGKQHISFVRRRGRVPNFKEFKFRIKYIKHLEESIAIKKGKRVKHIQKWSFIDLN